MTAYSTCKYPAVQWRQVTRRERSYMTVSLALSCSAPRIIPVSWHLLLSWTDLDFRAVRKCLLPTHIWWMFVDVWNDYLSEWVMDRGILFEDLTDNVHTSTIPLTRCNGKWAHLSSRNILHNGVSIHRNRFWIVQKCRYIVAFKITQAQLAILWGTPCDMMVSNGCLKANVSWVSSRSKLQRTWIHNTILRQCKGMKTPCSNHDNSYR